MMNQRLQLFSFLVLLVFCQSACKTAKPIVSNSAHSRQLCGTFVTENSLFDTLEFTNWNTVQLLREFIPPSQYLINGDTLLVIPDKSVLMYRIVDEHTLTGLGGWSGQDTLHRLPGSGAECTTDHLLTSEQRKWLDLNRAYYVLQQDRSAKNFKSRLRQLCENGHPKSCVDYGYLTTNFQRENPDLTYVQKACDMGYYMGCFRMAELLEIIEKKQEAKVYFQKACDMGHAASCLTLSFMDLEPEKK